METIEVRLTKNTPNTSTDDYIINFDIINPHEQYEEIKDCIHNFLYKKVGVMFRECRAINQACCDDDVTCYAGCKELVVYVSGLTIAVSELIRQCMFNGVNLTLRHCNIWNCEYFEQVIC